MKRRNLALPTLLCFAVCKWANKSFLNIFSLYILGQWLVLRISGDLGNFSRNELKFVFTFKALHDVLSFLERLHEEIIVFLISHQFHELV